ncbi:hypothetical protein [Leifsonia shinshuensis]|uniref:hypothetical protein n=1 Tax=Leifsonia shinshuensis TaxID=150026 RepID=UPI0005870D85
MQEPQSLRQLLAELVCEPRAFIFPNPEVGPEAGSTKLKSTFLATVPQSVDPVDFVEASFVTCPYTGAKHQSDEVSS